jgi:hypothetical protein
LKPDAKAIGLKERSTLKVLSGKLFHYFTFFGVHGWLASVPGFVPEVHP